MLKRSGSVALLLAGALLASSVQADSALEKGKQLTFERKKGNCLACHMIDDGELAGTIGPPLLMMKQRFPSKADLKKQIWDASAKNPMSVMPLFGKHRILSEEEIDLVVDYLYTL